MAQPFPSATHHTFGPLLYNGTIITFGPCRMARPPRYIVTLGWPSETGQCHCIMCIMSNHRHFLLPTYTSGFICFIQYTSSQYYTMCHAHESIISAKPVLKPEAFMMGTYNGVHPLVVSHRVQSSGVTSRIVGIHDNFGA
jgi:hypothetical protein